MIQEDLKYILKPDSAIYTRCFNDDEWLPNTVIEVNDNVIKINLTEYYFKKGIMVGNFISIQFSYQDHEYVLEGQINDIDIYDTYTISIFINNVAVYKNRRKHFRFYAKLGASLKLTAEEKGTYSIITNISLSGLGVISKADIAVKTNVCLDLFLSSKNIIPLKGMIVRKKALNFGYEYGISFTDMGSEAADKLKKLIDKLENKSRDISIY